MCGAEQKLFVSRAKKVSGFAQNQGASPRVAARHVFPRPLTHTDRCLQSTGYGLGSNSMTSEQKSLLIYGAPARGEPPTHCTLPDACPSPSGTLAFFFALFIGGYLLE